MNTQTRGPGVTASMVREFVAAVPRGATHPITAEALCWKLGIVEHGRPTNDNHRRLIRAMRQAAAEAAGVLVLGGNDGYYIPASMEEVGEAHGRRRSQALTMLDDLKAEEALAAAMFERQRVGGQLVLAW